jgi:Ca2+-binding RTX toxin-like protein
MAISTYDDTKTELINLLESSPIDLSSKAANYIADHLRYFPQPSPLPSPAAPIEIVSSSPPPSTYDPVPFTGEPELLILESSGNTVDTTLDPNLKFIVQAPDAELTITGNNNVHIVTADVPNGTGSYTVNLDDYGNDTVVTGNGNDIVDASMSFGTDSIWAGNGSEDELLAGAGDYSTLHAGSGNDDLLIGGGSYQSLSAGSGTDDELIGGGGIYQTLQAGDGNDDELYADTIGGGSGGSHDLLEVGKGDNDQLYGSNGDYQTLHAGGGNDDLLQAGNGSHDLLIADNGQGDNLYGGSGAFDTLSAGNGNDSLTAGNGLHQSLTAGTGNDTFVAGMGGDTLTGGGGNDTFTVGMEGNVTIDGGGGSDNVVNLAHAYDPANTYVSAKPNSDGYYVIHFSDTQQTVWVENVHEVTFSNNIHPLGPYA